VGRRKIIEIDRDLCNGCGECTTACDEGALELDDEGKAVLVRDIFCDGMGMCLNVCPTGALTITERESAEYDAPATREHVRRTRGEQAVALVHAEPAETGAVGTLPAPSELSQWPIQLHLITPAAPYFRDSDLLIAADCTAFTRGSFHADLLKGRRLIVACPKLDDTSPYVEKLAALFRAASPRSITVARMTVPCCGGLERIVENALALSKMDIPVETVTIDLQGDFVDE
jgi:NAD-dependent dihydropyrimidine dehydrogenase PreA subunit